MLTTPTSIGVRRSLAGWNPLRRLRQELIERPGVTNVILVLLVVALFAGTAVFLARFAFDSYEDQHRLMGLTASNEEQDKQLVSLTSRISQIDQQITVLRESRPELDEAERSTLRALALAPKLWAQYGDGVCLIAGSFQLVEPGTGRPLRFPQTEDNTVESLLVFGIGQHLTFEGEGHVFEQEFEATGFHVGGGFVLTNYHIAIEPWAADKRIQFVRETTGAIPRLKDLLAYFPTQRQPISLTVKSSSKVDDIAVCALRSKNTPAGIPSLPLDIQSGARETGKPVVTLGYPTGPDRLLALLPEREATRLMDQYGASLTNLLDQLAKRNLIRPLMTQGHITDLYKNRIVFDAITTHGSSGTPMFGESGKVIGVSFAILVDDTASNFAIGIENAIEQLRKAGWTEK
jgi:cell division protein FtsB